MGLSLRPESHLKNRGIRLNTTDRKTMILDFLHQQDTPVRTKQLMDFILEKMCGPDMEIHLEERKAAWQALDSLVDEGYIAELGGIWVISKCGMELMGWLV